LLGTDSYGRDQFSRLLYGGQISLAAGWIAAAFSILFGAIIGSLAGFYGGWLDEVLMRGGEFFPERTPVRLEGSTCGGSILMRRGIYVGLRMEIVPQPAQMVSRLVYDPTKGQNEILLGHKVITTSPIQSIGIVV